MVQNPLAEASTNGEASNKPVKVEHDPDRLSLESAAYSFRSDQDSGYVLSIYQKNGQWRRFMSNGLAPPHSAQFDRALNHSTALEMHLHEGGLLPRRNSPAQSDSPKFDDANVVIVQPSRKRARIVDDTDDGYIKVDEDASDNDDDEDSTSSPPSCLNNLPDPLVPISSISFADRDAVNKFLRKRIHDLQQLALKAVLKQWIKSVEPRKQSKYPYVAGKYPPWWPSNIRFKEPDHLHLHDRVELSLVILGIYENDRLVEDLDRSAQEHARRGTARSGWVDMLRNSTRDLPLVFDSERESQERKTRRKEILRDIYDAAFVMEEIHYEERDEDFTKTYTDPTPSKKGREPRSKRIKFEGIRSSVQPAGGPVGATPMKIDDASDMVVDWSTNACTASTSNSLTSTAQFSSIENSSRRPVQQRAIRPAATTRDMMNSRPTYALSRQSSTNSATGGIYHSSVVAPRQIISNAGVATSHPREFTLDPESSIRDSSMQYQDVISPGEVHAYQISIPTSQHQHQTWATPVSPNQNGRTSGPSSNASVSYQTHYGASPMTLSPMSQTDFSSFTSSPSTDANSTVQFHTQMEQMSGSYVPNSMAYDRTQHTNYNNYQYDHLDPMLCAPVPSRHDVKQDDPTNAFPGTANINVNYDHYQ